MEKVYLAKKIETILDKIDYSRLGNNVAIKVHFGEKGCNTYMKPELVKKVYDKVVSLNKKAALVECNVLYKGSRVSSTRHIKTAKEHGFVGMNIDILDGENGDEFIEINGCKIGQGIEKYDSIIVISHFKGHMAAGFGGALKNLGMGLGSRAGKLDMHSTIRPSINAKCVGCGKCIEICNAEAIILEHKKAKINQKKCEGCAMCIAVCNYGAINIPWMGRDPEGLQKRVNDYAKAVLTVFQTPIYINILENITEECDCMGIKQEPMMKDIGILYSNNIVAIDGASLDLANKHSNNGFEKINSIKKSNQMVLAEKIGLGKYEYELVDLG